MGERWQSTSHPESIRKDPSKDMIDSLSTVQDLLDQVQANSRQSVSILLDTANRLQVLEQLLLGWDSVDQEMKAVINSVKHIVQTALTTVQEQSILGVSLASVQTAEPSSQHHIVVGSVIKAIFCEYWLLGEGAQPCTATWTIEKRQGGQSSMTQAQSQALNDYPNKKNILKTGQGVVGDSNSNPIPVVREWIKIPKGKQRMGQGDALQLNVSCIGEADNGLELCGVSIYKEYQ